MKTHKCRLVFLSSLLFFSQASYGQSSGSGNKIVVYSLIGVGIVLLVWIILKLTDNLMQAEAKKQGADTKNNNFSIFPPFKSIFSGKKPPFVGNDSYYKLYKGYDIKLNGEVKGDVVSEVSVSRFAVRPPDYRGISPIPKLLVTVGDEVKAGQPVFFDKGNPEIKYVAPVSGEIVEVRRGQKRAIKEVIILADKEQNYVVNDIPSDVSDRQSVVSFLGTTGGWTLLSQRPFDLVPAMDQIPKNIFISTFDSSPLAPGHEMMVKGKEKQFQKGIDILSSLTDGKVHLGLDARKNNDGKVDFSEVEGAERSWFNGPHPSGNVGIQIHHIAPIKLGQSVWTLKVQDVITIGELFTSGKYIAERMVALTGSEIETPSIVKTFAGANVGDLIKGQLKGKNESRVICGNILTGRAVGDNDFISISTNQITAIKEGNYYELFGWLIPIKPRPSISRTFPNFLFPNWKFDGDTNTHGEKRAFVVTGQYESLLPMDVYPQHIMKAIMTNDFEKMEGLGLAELTEEDVALCEFACTSKMPLQNILRQGLDMLNEQS